jgi:ketosteroid isomerase-like protein
MNAPGSGDLAARIARLEAVDAILNIKHRYGELVDRLSSRIDQADLEALGELFTEDAFVDFVTVQLPGRQAILDLYGGAMQKNFAWIWHSFHSPIIDVHGDRASGRWTVQGMTITHDSPTPTTVYGRYVDEFVRTAQGWCMSKMVLLPGPSGTQAELKRG